MLSQGVSMLYSFFMQAAKLKERLKLPYVSQFFLNTATQRFVVFTIRLLASAASLKEAASYCKMILFCLFIFV